MDCIFDDLEVIQSHVVVVAGSGGDFKPITFIGLHTSTKRNANH